VTDPKVGSDSGPKADANIDAETEPDYRFTLANERTFLAYLRTALALDAGAAAAVQFLSPDRGAWIVRLVGAILAVAGLIVSAGAFVRWRANLTAMRRGEPLPVTRMPVGLAIAVLLVSAGAVALVLLDK
jgi:inner membrane protein YidH